MSFRDNERPVPSYLQHNNTKQYQMEKDMKTYLPINSRSHQNEVRTKELLYQRERNSSCLINTQHLSLFQLVGILWVDILRTHAHTQARARKQSRGWQILPALSVYAAEICWLGLLHGWTLYWWIGSPHNVHVLYIPHYQTLLTKTQKEYANFQDLAMSQIC